MRGSTRGLRIALAVWGAWEILNGVLATFVTKAGAEMVGWAPKFGWNSDILAMSAQYGMGLFLLGFVYLLASTDPVRYAIFVWVAVAEQGLGILIGFNGTFVVRTITVPQFFALVIINLIIATIFLTLRQDEPATLAPPLGAGSHAPEAARATAAHAATHSNGSIPPVPAPDLASAQSGPPA